MRKLKFDVARECALLVAVVMATSVAASADIFAWQTEDGVFSYTDDRKSIPARYAKDAVAVPDSRLGAYSRLTVEDTDAAREVTTRLERRLDYLRRLNTITAPAPSANATRAGGRTTISVATDSPQAPTLDIATHEGDGPIVVEPILTKESGDSRTRRATIVKQGDRTLAVLKGRSHVVNVNDDIHDEDRLIDDAR
jgi:hypothetical protein